MRWVFGVDVTRGMLLGKEREREREREGKGREGKGREGEFYSWL